MSQSDDPFYGCCDWIGNGRCHYPGVFQHGNGKWYCRQHDSCDDAFLGAKIVEQSQADIPNPNYSHTAQKAMSLAITQRKAEEFSAVGTHREGP